jgi:hypothetical protein
MYQPRGFYSARKYFIMIFGPERVNVTRVEENYTLKSFIICTVHPVLTK